MGLGGGGGYGDPVLRPRKQIEEDLRDGLISRAVADGWHSACASE
jgi:N-methylhydantoinase B/oxoprolinase/acetone carboxylase alpha subunit